MPYSKYALRITSQSILFYSTLLIITPVTGFPPARVLQSLLEVTTGFSCLMPFSFAERDKTPIS